MSGTSSSWRTASTRTRLRDEPPAAAGAGPGHVIYVNSLSKVVGGGCAARVGRRARARARADRDAEARGRLLLAALIQHIAARWLATGAYDRHVAARALLP